MRLTARIWALDDHTRTPIDVWQETVDASLLQTLSLRGVFVTYSGPDPTKNATNPPTVNLPAPTLANLQSHGGMDADDESPRGHRCLLERRSDELVRPAHRNGHQPGRLLVRVGRFNYGPR